LTEDGIYLRREKKLTPPPTIACDIFSRLSARWKTSPLKKSLPAMLVPGREGQSDAVVVAGVLGVPAEAGPDVGMVACAAGPSAAERGVAGRGEAIGDALDRDGRKVEDVDVSKDIDAELGPEMAWTAGAVVMIGFTAWCA
jgi:hypothetical protein